MIPEIFPKVFSNEYLLLEPKDSDLVMSFKGRNLIMKDENKSVVFPTVKDYLEINKDAKEKLLYLFKIDDESCFLWLGDFDCIPKDFEIWNLVDFRAVGSTEDYLKAFTARHLHMWYMDNKFCGRCGKPTTIGTKERNLLCECGNMIFPKIMPAVIVGVRNKDKLLRTRYKNRPGTNWALVAGFVEIGETAEECVAREVMEETGLKVKNITYYRSQPWGMDQDLLLGFFCDVDGDDTIRLDNEELSEGKWFTREEIEKSDRLQSLTATMTEEFRKGKDMSPRIPRNS